MERQVYHRVNLPSRRHNLHIFDTGNWGRYWDWAATDWCREQFGPEGPQEDWVPDMSKTYTARWGYGREGNRIYIFDPDDAFAFRMRWG